MSKHVSVICPKCGAKSIVNIPIEAYEAWQFGMNIQDAWPQGTPEERELLISGTCSDCQKGVFDESD